MFESLDWQQTLDYLLRLITAVLLGGVIGLEREMHGRDAGLRTNILVCLGSALFMILSISMPSIKDGEMAATVFRADPGRIAAQVVTGIGFIGAGVIIKKGLSVRGLTTAACLWMVSAIGMTVGVGFYGIAVAVTFIGLVTLIVLNRFAKLIPNDSYRLLEIRTTVSANVTDIVQAIETERVKVLYSEYEKNYETDTMTIRLTFRIRKTGETDRLSHPIISELEKTGIDIRSVRWFRK